MRISSNGRVTIPAAIREQAGLLPGTVVEVVYDGDSVRLFQARASKPGRGDELVARLRGSGSIKMTTDEIMALTRDE
jgi:AbrB family looped-hinge helix DNA binding protein